MMFITSWISESLVAYFVQKLLVNFLCRYQVNVAAVVGITHNLALKIAQVRMSKSGKPNQAQPDFSKSSLFYTMRDLVKYLKNLKHKLFWKGTLGQEQSFLILH